MSCLPPLVGPCLHGYLSAHWTASRKKQKELRETKRAERRAEYMQLIGSNGGRAGAGALLRRGNGGDDGRHMMTNWYLWLVEGRGTSFTTA